MMHSTNTKNRSVASWILLVLLFAWTGICFAQVERPGTREYPFNEHTPSYDEMVRGMRAFETGMYPAALSHYRSAARWADKFAQYNVGIMHLRGHGTAFDPARAWAWFELSAERGYPEMVETADLLWDKFNGAQQRRARDIYESELMPKYGDAERKEVTARRMERERKQATGSRTGSLGMLSMLDVIDRSGRNRSGDEFYDEEKWDFNYIVQYETQMMLDMSRGRVELGELVLKEDEETERQQ